MLNYKVYNNSSNYSVSTSIIYFLKAFIDFYKYLDLLVLLVLC
jgi:hypothetical protein